MPAPTPGYVKNMIRRVLREILDPSPRGSDVSVIWEFFESRCAYCGSELRRSRKEGHIDHLVSSSQGGANHLWNRVLSCATCNEKEKLDLSWEEFLRKKSPDPAVSGQRRERIIRWQEQHPLPPRLKDEALFEQVSQLAEEAARFLDEKVEQVRGMRQR